MEKGEVSKTKRTVNRMTKQSRVKTGGKAKVAKDWRRNNTMMENKEGKAKRGSKEIEKKSNFRKNESHT